MAKPYIAPKDRKDFKIVKYNGMYIKTIKNKPFINSCK